MQTLWVQQVTSLPSFPPFFRQSEILAKFFAVCLPHLTLSRRLNSLFRALPLLIFSFYHYLILSHSALHNFDCLRANKSTSAWGVEARPPFLDADFMQVSPACLPFPRFLTISLSLPSSVLICFLPTIIMMYCLHYSNASPSWNRPYLLHSMVTHSLMFEIELMESSC